VSVWDLSCTLLRVKVFLAHWTACACPLAACAALFGDRACVRASVPDPSLLLVVSPSRSTK